MRTLSLNTIRGLLVLCLAASGVQCSSKHPGPAGGNEMGTQGTGGGGVPYSTEAQVNAALNYALKLASENGSKNIFAQFWIDRGFKSKTDSIKLPTHLFPLASNLAGSGKSLDEIVSDDAAFNSDALMAFGKNKIKRLAQGNCLNTTNRKHQDASVSSFDLSGDICFSIGNLTRIPPSGILREVLSLMLHEATHLGGETDEDIAAEWYDEFSDYFGARFGELAKDTVSDPTLNAIEEDRAILDKIELLGDENKNTFKAAILAESLVQKLAMMPYIFDPLALKLKANPTHPELVNNYLNSVFALIEGLNAIYNVQPMEYKKPQFTIQSVAAAIPPPSIDDLKEGLNKVRENFLAFMGDSSSKSVCTLPVGAIDPKMFKASLTGVMNPIRLTLPPRACD